MLVWLDEADQKLLEDLHLRANKPRTQLMLLALRAYHASFEPPIEQRVERLEAELAELRGRLTPKGEKEP